MRRLVCILIITSTQAWGIVDIAPVEVGDEPGLSGNIAAAYSSKSGNTEKTEYDVSGKVQYDTNRRHLAFIQGSYARASAADVTTDDQRFAHARYLYRLHEERLYGELFVQCRQDFFKGIDHRLLFGGDG